jgi:LEA14-like dessication related protein
MMKARWLLLLTIAVLACSCSLYKAPGFEGLNDTELKDLTADHTNLNLSLVISNPNWYAITVKSLHLEIFDKSKDKLGDIVMTQPLKLPKHAADTVYFEIRLDTRKVAKILSYSSEKVEFTIKADAVAKVFGISKRIRLEQDKEVNFTQILEDFLPTIPTEIEIPVLKASDLMNKDKNKKLLVKDPRLDPFQNSPLKPNIFKVMKTSISDISLKETELTVSFLLFNPYGFAFTFRDFPADITINGKAAGRGKLAAPIVFNENVVVSEGELVFNLNNLNSLLLASGALIKKDLHYQVNGTLMIDGFGTNIAKPFKFRGTVEIGKKDKLDK